MRAAPWIGAALALVVATQAAGCALYNGVLGTCAGETYTGSVFMAIPDNNDAGLTNTIQVPLSPNLNGTPNGIGVKVNADHELEGDLTIRLFHNNVTVELDGLGDHGPFHEFDGSNAIGSWTLNVADTLAADTGFWNDWELVICGE